MDVPAPNGGRARDSRARGAPLPPPPSGVTPPSTFSPPRVKSTRLPAWGVSIDTLLADVEHDSPYVLAFCDGGYTTNLPLEDVTGGRARVAFGYDGEPLDPEHGGPARLLVPLLLEERQVGARARVAR